MRCKVCNRDIEKHSRSELAKCFKEGFELDLVEVWHVVDQKGIVVERTQETSRPYRFTLELNDRTIIATDDLLTTYVELALTRCYEKPSKAEVPEISEEPASEEE